MITSFHPAAEAYHASRHTGALDLPAYRAALSVDMREHPGADLETAGQTVALIIAEASQRAPDLLWEGVPANP